MLLLDRGGSDHPHCTQMTDVNPNRWGNNEPPERNDDQDDDLKAGEEVRDYKIPFNNRPSNSHRNSHRSPWISSSISPTRVIMTTINIPTTPGATATQVQ